MQVVKYKESLFPYRQAIINLYLQAFPIEERKPVDLLFTHAESEKSDIYIITDDTGAFSGFFVTIYNDSIMIIEYLAISNQARGKGIGSQAISWLVKTFPTHNLVVEIEETQVQAEDLDLRLKRRYFYEKHDFVFINQSIQFFDIHLELMATRPDLNYHDYIGPYEYLYGSDIRKKIYFLK